MQNLHSLKVDIQIVNRPHQAAKHYLLALTTENRKRSVCKIKTTTDSPRDLFLLFQTAGIAAALEMERQTNREFQKPFVVHCRLIALFFRLKFIAFKDRWALRRFK